MSILDERIKRREKQRREDFERFREELLKRQTKYKAFRAAAQRVSWERKPTQKTLEEAVSFGLEAALEVIDPDPLDTAEGQSRR